MPRSRFTAAEWRKIEALNPKDFGLPKRRAKSAVIGTFNTLKLGSDHDDAKHWDYLTNICKRFDFLAVQEVLDDLSGLERLVRGMRGYELLVSATTGKFPGAQRGLTERLAFIYRPDCVFLDDLFSDITYDRSWVLETLQQDRALWNQLFDDLGQRLVIRKQTGKGSRLSINSSTTPAFLTFIRQPHCAAFSLINTGTGSDIPFLAINAHLLYGNAKAERKREFDALSQWLIYRAQAVDRMYHTNMILFGDLNLEFKTAAAKRAEIDRLRDLKQGELGSANAALVNFPLLSVHPDREHFSASEQLFRTNARSTQTKPASPSPPTTKPPARTVPAAMTTASSASPTSSPRPSTRRPTTTTSPAPAATTSAAASTPGSATTFPPGPASPSPSAPTGCRSTNADRRNHPPSARQAPRA